MRFYPSLMRTGLMTGVAAAAIMAAGVAWAACAVTPPSFDPASAPNGAHVQSGSPSCTVNAGQTTVTCSAFEIGGIGNRNATESLVVVFQSLSTSQRGEVRNGQVRFKELTSGTPTTPPTLPSFTYKLTFDGFTNPYITITGSCS
jgi:hypothetical protein